MATLICPCNEAPTKPCGWLDVCKWEDNLWEIAHLHAQVLPAVNPGLEHWGVGGEPGLQPAREGEHVRRREPRGDHPGKIPRRNGLVLPLPTSRTSHPKGEPGCQAGCQAQMGGGRALDRPQQPWQSAWRRGAHLPTVVHSHEVTNQQERVGQHAHCNLKPRETCMSVTPSPAPPEPGSRGTLCQHPTPRPAPSHHQSCPPNPLPGPWGNGKGS